MTVQTTNIDASGTIAIDLTKGDEIIFTIANGVSIQDQTFEALLADSTQAFFIYNYGSIATIGDGVELLDSNDHFYNESGGSVFGGYGVSMATSGQTFVNYGDVSGLIYGVEDAAGTNIILNYGTIEGPSGALNVDGSGDVITNSTTGAIDGGITITSGTDTITNAGGIDGSITFGGSGNTNSLTNSGKITGAVAFSGGYNAVDNSGLIDGAVSTAHSHDTLTNTGTIDGVVTLISGDDTLTNAGAIDGGIMSFTSGTGDSLTNSGDVTGSIGLSAATSSLTNHGQIYGNAVLAGSDTLVNTGTIHGNVILSDNDTFDVSPGVVTGAIYASTVTGSPGDLFEFSGDFGKVTFDDFVGGTGTNHDTIQFAANDFGTFSQVQSASSQVGSDVVIKLDATDSITLNNATLGSLVSVDFTFV